MVKPMLIVAFWFGIAGYIALSLDGVIMGQSLVLAYLHNVPFNALPITNGLLLGIATMAAVFLTLAWFHGRD